MSKKFSAKKVWGKVFGHQCSKCGIWTTSYIDLSKAEIPIDVPKKNFIRYWIAKRDSVVLCDECFEEFDYDSGDYNSFKKKWSKLFKEVK